MGIFSSFLPLGGEHFVNLVLGPYNYQLCPVIGGSMGAIPICLSLVPCRVFFVVFHDSYLVDPASSHMLVSKIKPCMSKYKLLYGETANGSLNQL